MGAAKNNEISEKEATIEDLKNQVENMKQVNFATMEKIKNKNEEIDAKIDKISDLERNVDALNDELKNANEKIDDLEKQLEEKNKELENAKNGFSDFKEATEERVREFEKNIQEKEEKSTLR